MGPSRRWLKTTFVFAEIHPYGITLLQLNLVGIRGILRKDDYDLKRIEYVVRLLLPTAIPPHAEKWNGCHTCRWE